jgi:gliding motility-associated-like protein
MNMKNFTLLMLINSFSAHIKYRRCLMLAMVGMFIQSTFFVCAFAGTKPNTLPSAGFVPNQGQFVYSTGEQVKELKYKLELGGMSVWFTDKGFAYQVSKVSQLPSQNTFPELALGNASTIQTLLIPVEFVSALPNISIEVGKATEALNNYYYAHCPQGILNVATYESITYKNVWEHIDIRFYIPSNPSSNQGLKYDIIVHPGGDVSQVKFKYPKGIQLEVLNGASELSLGTGLIGIKESIPKVYLQQSGETIQGTYIANNRSISFGIESYDTNQTLVIDPWATYYGGTSADNVYGIANDNLNNVLLTGSTSSANFPIGAIAVNTIYQNTNAGSNDVFVLKLSPNGIRQWATYYGGTSSDSGYDIEADNQNNVIVVGESNSTNFPVSDGAFQPVNKNNPPLTGSNGIVFKLSSSGNRVWATYYGGVATVDVDNNNDIVVGGVTEAQNSTFPVLLAFQNNNGGQFDGTMAKLNGSDGYPQFSTYYGGNDFEYINGVAFDSAGDILATGWVRSLNFPVSPGAHQSTFGGGLRDAFLIKMKGRTDVNGVMGQRLWATYIGGSGSEEGYDVLSVNEMGNNVVYVAGVTSSTNAMSTPGVLHPTKNGGSDGFIQKFNAAGTRLWGTYLGGSGNDLISAIALDNTSNLTFLGGTSSADLLVSANALQKTYGGGATDAFFGKINPSGTALLCLSYLGGNGNELLVGPNSSYVSQAIAIDNNNNISLATYTTSTNLSTGNSSTGAYMQPNNAGGGGDVYIAQVCSECGNPSVDIVQTSPQNICPGSSVNLNVASTYVGTLSWSTGAGNVSSISASPASSGEIVVSSTLGNCTAKDSVRVHVNSITAEAGATQNITCTQTANLLATATGGSGAYTFEWTNGPSTAAWTGRGAGRYYVKVTDGGGCSHIDSVDVVLSGSSLNLSLSSDKTNICLDGQLRLSETVNGGTSPYTYTWLDDASGLSGTGAHIITPSSAGNKTYRLRITDANGCQSEQQVSVRVDALPSLSTSKVNASCGASDGSATVTATGNSPFTYAWNTTPVQSTATASNLAAGTYTVTVRDVNTCSNTASVSISNVGGPTSITTNITPASCDNSSDGNIEISSVTGGVAAYQYSFDNGTTFSTIANKSGLLSGSYALKVKDANNCEYSTSVMLPFTNATPVPNITGAKSVCAGDNATLMVSGGSTWLWNTGATTASITVSPASTTSYSVTASNGSCSAAPVSHTVTVNANPTASISGNTVLCSGSTTTLTAAGGTVDNWNTGATSQSITVSPASTTSYTVRVRNGDNCTGEASVQVQVNAIPPAPTVQSNTIEYCQYQNAAPLSATGENLLWYNSATAGTGSATAPSVNTNVVGSTDYYVSQSVDGCQSARTKITVTVEAKPSPPQVSGVVYCQDAQATALSAMGNNLLWYTSSSGGLGSTTAPTPNTSTPGTYYYHVSQSIGNCESDRVSISVKVNASPSLSLFGLQEICQGSSITLYGRLNNKAEGIFTYVLEGDTLAEQSSTLLLSELSAGQYTLQLQGKDAQGCLSAVQSYTLVVKPKAQTPVLSTGNVLEPCLGSNLNISLASPEQGAQYTWTGPNGFTQIGTTSINLALVSVSHAGSYSVVGALDGCKGEAFNFSVMPQELPDLEVTGLKQLCTDQSSTLSVSDKKNLAISYQWSASTQELISPSTDILINIKPIVPTTYTVIGTSAKGCVDRQEYFVQTSPFPLAYAGNDTSICFGDKLNLTGEGSSGFGLSYQWTPVELFAFPTQKYTSVELTQLGSYTLYFKVTEKGCEAKDTMQVEVRDCESDGSIRLGNAISPNGDGVNDYLVVEGEGIVDFNLKIYNRFGEMLFESSSVQEQWDGKRNDQAVQQGVYVYIITARNSKRSIKKTGTVSVIY